MAKVRLSEPCILNGIRHEIGEVVEVDDYIAELNSKWMAPTKDELTAETAKTDDDKKKK